LTAFDYDSAPRRGTGLALEAFALLSYWMTHFLPGFLLVADQAPTPVGPEPCRWHRCRLRLELPPSRRL